MDFPFLIERVFLGKDFLWSFHSGHPACWALSGFQTNKETYYIAIMDFVNMTVIQPIA
jgi:hypothetical protein